MKKRLRQSSYRALSSLSAQIQSLEQRTLPAGTVIASISGGNITLNGDRFANVIEVDLTSSGIFVRGLDGTNIKFGVRTITDGSPVKLAPGPRVTTDLVINLKDGNDAVSIVAQETAAVIGRNLKIDTGRGTDFVELLMDGGSLTVGNELDIKLGDDSDYLLLSGDDFFEDVPPNHEESETAPLHVSKTAKINSGTGDDVVGVDFFSAGGNLQIETGHGDDTVGIDDARIGGNAVISTGSGDDDIGIAFVLVEGSASITTGSGDDRVGILNTHSQGNVTVLLQQGNDTLAAAGELTVGEDAQVTLNGGSGFNNEVDTLAADTESALATEASVIGFEAFDSPELAFDILDNVFDEIFFDE